MDGKSLPGQALPVSAVGDRILADGCGWFSGRGGLGGVGVDLAGGEEVERSGKAKEVLKVSQRVTVSQRVKESQSIQ